MTQAFYLDIIMGSWSPGGGVQGKGNGRCDADIQRCQEGMFYSFLGSLSSLMSLHLSGRSASIVHADLHSHVKKG